MALDNTKLTLRRLRGKYGDYLREAKKDIKPNYSGKKIIEGYSYTGIDDNDRDFIYHSIGGLDEIVNDRYGGIHFDIDNVFITEAKAITELKLDKDHISNTLDKLRSLKDKYVKDKLSPYPIEVCYNVHKEINDLLNEVINSDEFKEFENPGMISQLTNDNIELKFKLYWNTKRWKYLFHLIAFIPFIAVVIYAILHKDDQNIVGLSKTILLVFSALLTIIFNLGFNNHSSFKDSFKLILSSSRKKLIQKEKVEFHKTH